MISGDVLTDIDLGAIVDVPRRARGAWPRSASTHVENPLEFGIVITREDGTIERFLEKPTWGQVFTDTINTGIYVLEPEIFDYIDAERRRSTSPSDVFPALLADGKPLFGAVAEGYWEDVGTLEAYVQRPQGRPRRQGRASTSPASELGDGVWLGEGAEIHPDAAIDGPGGDRRQLPGRGRRPHRRVHGARRRRAGARRRRPRAHRRPRQRLPRRRACACGARSSAGRATCAAACACEEGVVLGDECFVGENAVIDPGVKVYPFKTVEAGAVVNSSIVWESRGARSLFGRDGVAGLANVDITPELAAQARDGLRHHAARRARRSSRRATRAGRPAC